MDIHQLYRQKTGSLEAALNLIHSGDRICMAGDCNEAQIFAQNLHTIAPRVESVKVLHGRNGHYDFISSNGMAGHFRATGFFYGPDWHIGHPKGNTEYVPSDLPDYAASATGIEPFNVFVAGATPMDENGDFYVSLCVMYEIDLFQSILRQPDRRVILEVNPNEVKVSGALKINIRDVDCLYEVDYPLLEIPAMETTPTEDRIGGMVAELIHDGDTLQLGIGALPNAIAHHLMDKQDMGLHTEMYTSAMGEMLRRGVITGERKNYLKGLSIGTFAGGDRALYETMRDHPTVRVAPGSFCVDPTVIMRNDNMVSINTILEMDLTGQVNSETIGTRQYSGSGGGFCFAYGAMHSKGGRGILAFSARSKKGIPKIKATLTPGSAVTIPRNYVDYIVTEYGVARLRGCSVRERCELLIALAHPDDRAELRQKAREYFYI